MAEQVIDDLWKILEPFMPLYLILIPIAYKCGAWSTKFTSKFDALVTSIKKIENAVTSVDLQEMAQQLSQIAGTTKGKTIGNTVTKVLKKTGVTVDVSLSSLGPESSINLRFSQAIDHKGLSEAIVNNKELSKEEKRLFGNETKIFAYSPRGLMFKIPSDNLDLIADFIVYLLKVIHDILIDMNEFEKDFDEKVRSKMDS